KIDQILSSKPEERRYLFEEAAGITKHKVRSREAELKLDKTEENMRQVAGILGEVKRSHDLLKSQSEKTLKYRAFRDEIFEKELDLHLIRLRQFVQEKDRRDEEMASKTKARDALKAEIDGINLSLEENLDIVNSMESSLVQHQKTVYGLAVEKVGKEKQRKLLSERLIEAKSKMAQAQLRAKGVADKIEGLKDDESEKEGDLATLKSRLREIEANVRDFEANIRSSEARVAENEAAVRKAEGEILGLERDRAEARVRLDAITEDIVAELDARLRDTGYSSLERGRAEEAIEALIALLETRLGGKAAILEDLVRLEDYRTEEARARIEGARAAIVEALATAGDLRSRFGEYRRTAPSFIDEFLSPEGIITKKRAIDLEIASCDDGVSARRERIGVHRAENLVLMEKLAEYRATLEELRGNRIRVETQAQAGVEALGILRREISSQETYLKELENEAWLEGKKVGESEEELGEIDSELADIEKKGRELQAEAERLEREIAVKNSDLSKRQEDLKRKMERLASLQVEIERVHMGLAQTETEIRNIKENFEEQYSRDLMEFEIRMFEVRTPITELREAIAALRQKLRDLGSVNLMAPEEYGEVKERYDFLSTQLGDLESAKADLKRITEEIRNESAELFLNTYNRIKKNFHNMFRRLFGGGRGELRLVDPDHVLESGIEIYAQPPGKKLEAITLLSGGEKTLTAIAMLFATYMVRPSPFCFLDEIDAALDEQNVIRFVNLLREFGRTSQFVVITHNKKTVTGADALLGVTMEESGVTKAIAIRLERSDGEAIRLPEPLSPMDDEEVEYERGGELPPDEGPKAPTPPRPKPSAHDTPQSIAQEARPTAADVASPEETVVVGEEGP
ncbi:MAG: AAA family ATPase, partial [Spirochaetota bacterium]